MGFHTPLSFVPIRHIGMLMFIVGPLTGSARSAKLLHVTAGAERPVSRRPEHDGAHVVVVLDHPHTSARSSAMRSSKAFITSGRFNVIVATPWPTSKRIVVVAHAAVPPGSLARAGGPPRHLGRFRGRPRCRWATISRMISLEPP